MSVSCNKKIVVDLNSCIVKILYRFLFVSLTFLLVNMPKELKATHNRAGEITYEQIGPLTIRMLLVTYTKSSSSAADRDSVEILWGDGSKEWIARTNGTGLLLPNDLKRNEYVREHTYPGRGTYTIFFTDPNRIGNILNINFPNSIDIPFSLTSTFTLLDPQFQGLNNSVKLLQPPIDFACVGKRFIHNPNAFDADGDSLAYEFAVPAQSPGSPVPQYLFPDKILPGPNNIIQLNPKTGEFIWQSPPQQGEYNIAIRIKEYRQGRLINSTIRDMQILVRTCQSEPPSINSPDEICIIAGKKLSLSLQISDPDKNQLVEVTSSGGPFIINNPATITPANSYRQPPYTSLIEWNTDCNHISEQPYKVVVRAVDNSLGDTTGLSTLKTILVKVIGPPPVLRSVTAEDNAAVVRWNFPYECENARDNFFLGFSVWRAERSVNSPSDSCQTGVDKNNYTKVIFLTKEKDALSYVIRDRSVTPGKVYCYRIVAEFARYTSTGNPFGVVESIASNELCFSTSRVVPYITKTSVLTTGNSNGTIEVSYTKPDSISFNTLAFPGPYRIELFRKPAGSSVFTKIDNATKNFTQFSQITDTTYVDENLNTIDIQYEYQVRFFTSTGEFGVSLPSRSVFLTASGTKDRVNLSWLALNPWSNFKFYIYRSIGTAGNFVLIDSTANQSYADTGLSEGTEYCYYVQSFGTYNIPFIAAPIINNSQIKCARPVDNRSPCPPELTVVNLCDEIQNKQLEDLKNFLSWTDPNAKCSYFENVRSYRVYYAPDSTANEILISTIADGNNRTFEHISSQFGLQGCYRVTALDSLDNESVKSNKICMMNCPLYELPNTFTPNQDGNNDVYVPMKNFFVVRVDFKLYNQWGTLIFSTDNPGINWTGENYPEGTYYYTCKVYNRNLDGTESADPGILSGFINLLR
jgi:gliding motility-associated-like protein